MLSNCKELNPKMMRTMCNNKTNDNFLSMDISQNAPLKMILMPTGKKLPLPVMKNDQSLGADGKIQTKQIYDAHDLSTRICRAYYKFCIGAKLGRKSRKLLLKYGVLQYAVVPPIDQA